jgi:hypothetical protein
VSVDSYVEDVSTFLAQPWPRNRVLSGNRRIWKQDSELVKKILEVDLVPEDSCIELSCKDFSLLGLDGPWLKEKWYGTEYMTHKIDQEILQLVSSYTYRWVMLSDSMRRPRLLGISWNYTCPDRMHSFQLGSLSIGLKWRRCENSLPTRFKLILW